MYRSWGLGPVSSLFQTSALLHLSQRVFHNYCLPQRNLSMLWRISLQWGRFYFPIIWQKAIARLDHLLCSFARFLLLGVSDFLWYLDPCGNWRRQMWYNSSPFQLFELSSNIKCSFHHIQCEPCIPRHFCHFPCSIFYPTLGPRKVICGHFINIAYFCLVFPFLFKTKPSSILCLRNVRPNLTPTVCRPTKGISWSRIWSPRWGGRWRQVGLASLLRNLGGRWIQPDK